MRSWSATPKRARPRSAAGPPGASAQTRCRGRAPGRFQRPAPAAPAAPPRGAAGGLSTSVFLEPFGVAVAKRWTPSPAASGGPCHRSGAASARLHPIQHRRKQQRRQLWLGVLGRPSQDAAARRTENSALTVTAVAMARILPPRHGIGWWKSPTRQNGRPLVLWSDSLGGEILQSQDDWRTMRGGANSRHASAVEGSGTSSVTYLWPG